MKVDPGALFATRCVKEEDGRFGSGLVGLD
jgi:hypothetical protein